MIEGDYAGFHIASVADANGDGLPELGVAPVYTGGVDQVYCVMLSPIPSGTLGVECDRVYVEATQDALSGYAADSTDLDGDGYGDLALGAPAGDEDRGRVSVFLGGNAERVTAEDARTTILGSNPTSTAGCDVSFGDVEGDGTVDLAVGACSAGADYQGTEAIFLGAPVGTLEIEEADVLITGETSFQLVGFQARIGSDFDLDGASDLVVTGRSPDSAGQIFVFFAPTPGERTTAEADLVLFGVSGDLAGYSLDDHADVDGDGHPDILVGAPGYSAVREAAGAAILLGGAVVQAAR